MVFRGKMYIKRLQSNHIMAVPRLPIFFQPIPGVVRKNTIPIIFILLTISNFLYIV